MTRSRRHHRPAYSKSATQSVDKHSWTGYDGYSGHDRLRLPRRPIYDDQTHHSDSQLKYPAGAGNYSVKTWIDQTKLERSKDRLEDDDHDQESYKQRDFNIPNLQEHKRNGTNEVNFSQQFETKGETDQPASYTARKPRQWYGFNLPTSERLRTRNSQALEGNLRKRGILLQSQNSSGGSLIVSSGLIVRGFTEKTTSHGLPHIYFASGVLKKGIWAVVTVAAIVVMCLHLYQLINNWSKKETGTRLTWTQERRLIFPAVTICNYNSLKLSTLKRQGSLDSLIGASSDDVDDRGGNQRASLRNELLSQLATEFTALSDEEFSALGHNASEMAIFCSFHGEQCDSNDFIYFRDSRYGNCVTFNSGIAPDGNHTDVNVSEEEEEKESGGLKTASVAGPQYGLSLVVYVEQFDYIPVLTEAVGARVVIHNQTVMPFPEQNAISVTANTLVNIGIKQRLHKRLSGKFGNCTEANDNTNNIYKDKYNREYSLEACLKTCYQREVTKQCRCFHSTIPFIHNSDVYKESRNLAVCNNSIPSEGSCLVKVEDEYEDGITKCDYCYQPCTERKYDTSFSSAIWPARSYVDDFTKELRNGYPSIMKTIEKNAFNGEGKDLTEQQRNARIEDLVTSNFLRLNIYYEDLQVATYEEIIIYDDFQFASDLGGSFGLWVGWSIITMIEFIEVSIDLLVFLCYGSCGNKKYNKEHKNSAGNELGINHQVELNG